MRKVRLDQFDEKRLVFKLLSRKCPTPLNTPFPAVRNRLSDDVRIFGFEIRTEKEIRMSSRDVKEMWRQIENIWPSLDSRSVNSWPKEKAAKIAKKRNRKKRSA